jgi:hypothetical protein
MLIRTAFTIPIETSDGQILEQRPARHAMKTGQTYDSRTTDRIRHGKTGRDDGRSDLVRPSANHIRVATCSRMKTAVTMPAKAEN